MKIGLVLASASSARLEVLKKLGIMPDAILATDIDEAPLKRERPYDIAARLCVQKAKAAIDRICSSNRFSIDGAEKTIIVSADTVVSKGHKVLPKAESDEDVEFCMKTLSDGGHKIYTGVCVAVLDENYALQKLKSQVVQTRVKFKRLSDSEIKLFVKAGQGIGKAGGYTINGIAESFITQIVGSVSNVVGLPTYQTIKMLKSAGYVVSYLA